MGFIQKHSIAIIIVFLTGLYFVSRLYNILGLPIFTDEAIYIRWSQIALNDPVWRFISLTDGKQPMFIWIAMLFLKFFDDPLLAGRLVSVFSGLFSMIGIFFLTKELFGNKKIALLASFLYIIFPFAMVYDRIALYDSLVACILIWTIYFEILLIKHVRLDLALILGMIVGAGMLTKTSAVFALILLPFSLILFNFKVKNLRQKLFHWTLYAIIAAGIANLIYAVLRLSQFYYIIEQKNYVFIYPFSEWIKHPFEYFLNNLSTFESWLIDYATLPFFILVFASFLIHRKSKREKLIIYFWFLIPLLSTALFGRLLYPRFLLFMTIPLIPLAAYTLYLLMLNLRYFYVKGLIFIFFVALFLLKDYYIISDFKKASILQADKGQFITGWPSGVGVARAVKFLREESKNKKIFVGTQGTFGLMPYSLEIYLHESPNIKIMGFWPTDVRPPKEVISHAAKTPTYFVFYQACDFCSSIGIAPDSWSVKKIFQIEKEEKGQFFTLYKIEP